MCDFRLEIPRIESMWRFNFHDYFRNEYEALQRMQQDGLLEIEADKLQILPAGRLLVRNICMVFDRYLQDGSTGTRFSKVI